MHRFHRRLGAALVLATFQLTAWASLAPSADAHPYGPLQTADVAVTDGRLVVTWHFGASDDISYLAAALEVLPPERTTLDGAILYQDGDADQLSKAPAFTSYLTEHIVVSRSGTPCVGEAQPTADLVEDGVPVAFSCPAGSGPVSITIDMLFDLHPAYRTLATGTDGQYGEYVADDATHEWDLELPADRAGDHLWRPVAAVIAAATFIGTLAAGGWWRVRGALDAGPFGAGLLPRVRENHSRARRNQRGEIVTTEGPGRSTRRRRLLRQSIR